MTEKAPKKRKKRAQKVKFSLEKEVLEPKTTFGTTLEQEIQDITAAKALNFCHRCKCAWELECDGHGECYDWQFIHEAGMDHKCFPDEPKPVSEPKKPFF